MSTVIAFPVPRSVPPKRGPLRRPPVEVRRGEGANIVILPVVRIERHDAILPGPVPRGGSLRLL